MNKIDWVSAREWICTISVSGAVGFAMLWFLFYVVPLTIR